MSDQITSEKLRVPFDTGLGEGARERLMAANKQRRLAAREIDRFADRIEALEAENEGLREVIKGAERAIAASYFQAHAEWQNHSKAEARHEETILQWREARDAALNQQGNRGD